MRGSAIRNIGRCRKNAEPRIAPGRFSRSLTVISDNCLSVLLLVGSELPEQDFASEIFKQGVPLFRVEMDDCGLRFLRGQSSFFEPLCSRREPCPARDCGSDIKLMPFRMAGLEVLDMCEKRLHEMIYSLVAFRVGRPIIGNQDGSYFDCLDWSIVRNELRIITRRDGNWRIIR